MKEGDVLLWLELMANLTKVLLVQCDELRSRIPDGWCATDECLEVTSMKLEDAHKRLANEAAVMKREGAQ
jgi:hypothetical protein